MWAYSTRQIFLHIFVRVKNLESPLITRQTQHRISHKTFLKTNSIQQLTTVINCYILFVDRREEDAVYDQSFFYGTHL